MDSLSELEEYQTARPLKLEGNARLLYTRLRNQLVGASNDGKLASSPAEIHRLIQFFPSMHERVADDVRRLGVTDGAFSITGGEKNQARSTTVRHFKRNDGAWFDFTLTGRQGHGCIELLAYDFEIRLAPGFGTPFLRFDLNLPGHRNESRDLRCHVHCGSDDLLLPAPLMAPRELLTLMIDGIPFSPLRERRTVTPFELNWLSTSLSVLSRS